MNDVDSQLEAWLDDLSLSLVTADPDDLITLGDLLNKIENLQAKFTSELNERAAMVLTGLKKALEAIILDQVTEKDQVMELIGQGVSLVQEAAQQKDDNTEFDGDLTGFLAGLKAAADIDAGILEEPAPEALPDQSEQVEPPPAEAGYEISQDQDLFFGFITESLEHIDTIEVNIISLEQDPGDLNKINSIFRPFHTIKGVSGFLNLAQIHNLTHDVENLLDDARNERITVTPALIDIVLDAVDLLKKMIGDVKITVESGQAPDVDYGIDEFINRVRAVHQGESGEEQSAYSDYSGWLIGAILIDQGLIEPLELESVVQAQTEDRLRPLGQLLVDKGIIATEDLEESLRLQVEQREKKLGQILVETGKTDPATISRAVQNQKESRQKKLGEILVQEKQASPRDVTTALREQKKLPKSSTELARTVKVDTSKLDLLVDLVGELVIAQSLINANPKINELQDQKISRDLAHMSRITSELQRTAMSMRMVPIRQTFQKMIRLVRDLARKSGKMVDLTMSGEDTEIDRNMVEAIYDPLVHMIRNSVDHGLEMPALRQEKGKPTMGQVHLRAFHQGGNVVIEIEDDGQGLNRDKILAKAIERGLPVPEDASNDSAVYNLIFQAGFSTAEQITDVSGRGVGMDVVKKAIDKLRGKIEIRSKPDKGATITIRLPLTLAIIDGMVVRVGGNRYILPTMSIRESFRPCHEDYFTIKGRGEMIKVRETLMPLVRLDQILEVPDAVQDPTAALVVVLENEGDRRCIMVDEVVGKQEVVIKSLGPKLKHIRSVAGGSIMGDGKVGLILDMAGLFKVSDTKANKGALSVTDNKPISLDAREENPVEATG